MVRWPSPFLAATLVLVPGAMTAGAEARPSPGPERGGRVAFVLLREAKMPPAFAVVRAFGQIAGSQDPVRLAVAGPSARSPGAHEAQHFELGDGGEVMVALVPGPVPGGEAEAHARWSLHGVLQDWALPAHRAHLVVYWRDSQPLLPAEGTRRFAWVLASVAKAAGAVGVYWADSGATHEASYFAEAAGAGLPLSVTIWSGTSVASDRGDPERMSLVSLGMAQLGLPNLELSVPRSMAKREAVMFMVDLLAMVARRGKAIPEGDTVGRTADERLPVRYAPSPIDPGERVWRVEIPNRPPGGSTAR